MRGRVPILPVESSATIPKQESAAAPTTGRLDSLDSKQTNPFGIDDDSWPLCRATLQCSRVYCSGGGGWWMNMA
ncbi:hypothetical protein CDEST_05000 [Colletotrichum destructivum]|uniref:Uncharacterized protein n=1 Tax=Colletotrichum destructivum TaxID=34406 RepID=A0AAX4I9G3_9PEZI|nr:hypothetical protein CDEST_05000 [Colletotrichum destructivum]